MGRKAPDKSVAHLVVGLGNPGDKYQGTRHNVGFDVIDRISRRLTGLSEVAASGGSLLKGRFRWRKVFLLKPMRYMNLSGAPVAALLKSQQLAPQHILVAHDDLDLPLGSLRLRTGGGSGGHRGIQDIIDSLASERFNRLRFGIGRPPRGNGEDFVLESFSQQELDAVETTLKISEEVVLCWLVEGVQVAMNRYNAPLPPAGEPDASFPGGPVETDPRRDSLGGHRGGEAETGGSEGALQ